MRGLPGLPGLALILCLFAAIPAWTQELSIDQIFDAPPGDIEVSPVEGTQVATAFKAQPLTITGSLSVSGGAVLGFSDHKAGSGLYDGTFDFHFTPGLIVTPSLTFVSRPDETIRVQGTVAFPSPGFAPSVSEMFFDYSFHDSLFFRVGKHTISWAVSRFFDGGGDLMSPSASYFASRVTMPFGPSSLSAVVLIPQGLGSFAWRSLTYGALGDLSFGKVELLLSGTYLDNAASQVHANLALKASLFGIDCFGEGVGSWARETLPSFSGLITGLFWQGWESSLKVYGEYYFNALDVSARDQRIALAVGAEHFLGSPFSIGLQWAHAFLDDSGIVIPVVSMDPWPHATIQLGLPCRYGNPGGFYLLNGPPAFAASAADSTAIGNWVQRYGIMLKLNISTGF